MIGILLIAAAGATALLVAATLRLTSLVSAALVAYLCFVADLGVVTLALSPFEAVTRSGLAVAQAMLLAGALAGWWLRGRPSLPLAASRQAISEIVRDPVTAVFLAVVLAALGYELLLALTVPPNNWDALTYHLARVAAWAQDGGIHWIPNAPSDRLNEFQPVAEQQILFLFVATGGEALFALPQFLAELAILIAVYGAARRLGFGVRSAACSAFLLATFTLVAVESTTAQNDLVAASFVAVAACLILGGSPIELAFAGAAVGIGVGAKLTTLLVVPVLAWLVAMRGRRAVGVALAGAVVGFVALGMWGFVLNELHTDHLLGHGGGRVENAASPSYPGSLRTGLFLLYETLDLGRLSDGLITALVVVGSFAAVAAGAYAYRRAGPRVAVAVAAGVAVPFLAPLLVIGGGHLVAYETRRLGFPARGPYGFIGPLNRTANEDFSAFGPVGAIVLLGIPYVTLVAYARRRVDDRHLALALALPSFFVLLSLYAGFNFFLTRFLLVPAVLTAPLLAILFRFRAVTAAYLAVASITIALTLAHIPTKPLDGPDGRPWQLTRAEAANLAGVPALGAFEQAVPTRACIGAVMGPDEPSYLLWGPNRERKIFYLPVNDAVSEAYKKGLFYVVISSGPNRWVAAKFKDAGWTLREANRYWLVAVAPGATTGDCSAD